MGYDLSPTREGFAVQDRTWLRDLHGLNTTLGATLDGSLFDTTRFPDGAIPSGTVLAQVTATRLWGPFDPAATDGRQTPVAGKIGHLLDAESVRPGRRNTVAILDAGAILEDYLPVPAATLTPAQKAIGVLSAAVKAVLPRVRYTNGKAA